MGALTLDLAREALNHRMDRHLCRSLEPRTLDVRSVLESVLRLPKTRFRVQGFGRVLGRIVMVGIGSKQP